MKIEAIKTDELIPYARNARQHAPEQVAQIAASIREFGFNNPVLIDQRAGIIAGHGRVLAAQKLGLETVPCIRLGHLTEVQKRAYIIADNRLAETSTWSLEQLALELEDLRLEEFDIDLTGFSAAALEGLFQSQDARDENPDPDNGDSVGIEYQEKYAVLVECRDEPEQASVFSRLTAQGLTCKVLVN